MASPAEIVEMAKRYLGVPYVFGGTNPKKGLDCSGLVQLVYKNLGIKLPRLVRHQRLQGRAVSSVNTAQPGDLLVFNGYQHIGIYLGGGMMLHAPQPGEKVKIGKVYAKPTSIRRIIGDGGNGAGKDLSGAALGGTGQAKSVDMATLASRYGYSMAFFKSDKSLWALINKAVKDQLTPDEFAAQLKNTAWYRSHSASDREWRTLERVDPASARAKMHATKVQLIQLGQRQGIHVDPKRLADMAWRVNAYGWDEAQVSAAMAAEMRYDPKKTNAYYGEMATNKANIVKQAESYGVQLSEQTIFNLLKQTVNKQVTEGSVTEYIKKQAKVKYKSIADDIDRGMTVADYASPYIEAQARLLELNPADVHLMDSHIQRALQFQDPKTGKAVPETLFDFETRIKSDGRWMKTRNGRDTMMDGARQVLADWGLG